MTIESQLPALGLGTAPLGGLYEPVERGVAVAAVRTAVAEGYQYFDTAPFYGYGDSERALGDVLAEHPIVIKWLEMVGSVLASVRKNGSLTKGPPGAPLTDRQPLTPTAGAHIAQQLHASPSNSRSIALHPIRSKSSGDERTPNRNPVLRVSPGSGTFTAA